MKKIVLIFLMVLLTCINALAQIDRSKKPVPAPAPEIKIGDYETFQLENGLKVFVVENSKLPSVTVSLVFHRDLLVEGENAGYVGIAGELMRSGTINRTKAELDEEVDFMGAGLNTSSVSVTGNCLSKHVDKYFEILSDVVLNSNFQQEELDKIKTRMISNIATEKDDPNAIASHVRNALVFGLDHPKGEQMTEQTVESVTLEMCKQYYETFFTPSAAYMAIVGDIDEGDAKDLVEKYFGNWKAKEVPGFSYPVPKKPLIRKIALVDRPASVQSVIHISYPIELEIGSEDVIKVSVLNKILGGSWSRFDNNIRETHGYAYYARSSMSPDRTIAYFDAFTEARNEVTDSVITEFLNEMNRIKDEKVTDDELQLAKNYLTGSFSRSLEQPQTIASFATNIARHNLPKDYYKNYLKKLNAVTADDVLEMAKKYIKPNNSYVIVVGNAEEVKGKLKKFSASGKITYYDIYGNEYDPALKKLPEGLTAQIVVENHIDALGGREKLEKVIDRTTVMKGKVQGMDLTLTLAQKAPNKYFQEFDAGVMKQTVVFDGTKGKQIAMGSEKELEGIDLEEMKLQSVINLFLDFGKFGIETELKGIEEINGKDCYKVVLKLPIGKEWIHYFNAESGYKVREMNTVETPNGSFTQTIDFGDYKEVDGIMYPFKVSQSFGLRSVDLDIISIEVNKGLDDSMFEVK